MPLIKNIYTVNKLRGYGIFDAVVIHTETSYEVEKDITIEIWRELI